MLCIEDENLATSERLGAGPTHKTKEGGLLSK